ncbi:MAG TPA: ATP-binding cassette domain-containing protein, partial [Clostridiales bacterium]|nr:ATP-binding cassette domain-containing protein [Clostridiales bacterium]
LSGGEKARASLLKLMLKGPNFLVLDEPTNHLDIASREALERALAGYDGTLLAVSHDRYFINKLATRTLFLTPKGVESCDGGYDEYLEKSLAARAAETAKPAPKTGNEYFAKKERASRLRRLEGEIARCEDSVTGCESKVGEIGRMLSDPVKASDYEEVLRLTALLAETEKQRDELIARWEELHRQYENLCLEGAL